MATKQKHANIATGNANNVVSYYILRELLSAGCTNGVASATMNPMVSICVYMIYFLEYIINICGVDNIS